MNRKIVDPTANRYFFVPDPVTATIEGVKRHTARAMLHPGDAARGSRTLDFNGTVLIPNSEVSEEMSMIRLKDLFNVKVTWNNGTPTFTFCGDSLADARAAKARIIQWLPAQDAVACSLLTQEGEMNGACEPLVRKELGNVVQFERVGFARIDCVDGSGIRAYFTHK